MFFYVNKIALLKRAYSTNDSPPKNAKEPNVFQKQRKKFQRAWIAFNDNTEFVANPVVKKQNRKLYLYLGVGIFLTTLQLVASFKDVEDDE